MTEIYILAPAAWEAAERGPGDRSFAAAAGSRTVPVDSCIR